MKFVKHLKTPNGILILLAVLSTISLTFTFLLIAVPLLLLGKAGTLFAIGVYLIFLIIPTLFIIGLLARGVYWLIKHFYKPIHWFFCIFIALIILTIPPYFINKSTNIKINKLIADDTTLTPLPKPIDTLAIISNKTYFDGFCEQICQRLLLNEQVKKIILVSIKQPFDKFDPALEGNAYWREERDNCPDIEFNSSHNPFRVSNMGNAKNTASQLRLKAIQGNCIISGRQKISTADMLIVEGTLIKSKRRYDNIRLNPFTEAIHAKRLSIYLNESIGFQLHYQATDIKASLLMPILSFGPILNIKQKPFIGYFHNNQQSGNTFKSLPEFLNRKIDFRLYLNDQDSDAEIKKEAILALNKTSKLSKIEISLIKQYVNDIDPKKEISHEKALFILRILQDRRIDIPYRISNNLRLIYKQHEDLKEAFKKTMLERFSEFVPNENITDIFERYSEFANISSTFYIGASDTQYIPFQMLETLAHDKVAREFGIGALQLLSNYSKKGSKLSLYLIRDKAPTSITRNASHSRKHFIAEALRNVCTIKYSKAEEQEIIQQLYSWLDNGDVPALAKFWRPTATTLFVIGAKSDGIWSHIKVSNKKLTRKLFNNHIKNVRSSACNSF